MRDLKKNIGSFMIAVGAIIELKGTNKILLIKRSDYDIKGGTWESMYGRIGHHEELVTALQREVFEETGIKNIRVQKLSRIWHIYRGEKHEDTELYGLTFICESDQEEVILSNEHTEYRWVTPEEGIEMVETEGVKEDLRIYSELKENNPSMYISDIENHKQLY